ncbi:hypothetical protein STRDD13_01127 [Streptococcus sp. DD13]|nr:hypothetical protein STRDD13_01127 [Streptococcus sp. DD13]
MVDSFLQSTVSLYVERETWKMLGGEKRTLRYALNGKF